MLLVFNSVPMFELEILCVLTSQYKTQTSWLLVWWALVLGPPFLVCFSCMLYPFHWGILYQTLYTLCFVKILLMKCGGTNPHFQLKKKKNQQISWLAGFHSKTSFLCFVCAPTLRKKDTKEALLLSCGGTLIPLPNYAMPLRVKWTGFKFPSIGVQPNLMLMIQYNRVLDLPNYLNIFFHFSFISWQAQQQSGKNDSFGHGWLPGMIQV